jgi:hypothetical protein
MAEALWEAILHRFQQGFDALSVLDLCAHDPGFEH